MKVLIVDDEIKVCKLLQNLVDWKELEMEIIGVANDGNEALAFILDKRPDIVITDIRMPGCDGIEMIRRVREHDTNVHFVLISGYSQFEYAVSAIRYGVEDYLLKPIKQKDLERILNKISNKNHCLHAAKDERETMLKRMELDAQQIKTHYLREIWNNFTETNRTTLEPFHQNSRFSFTFNTFALVLVQFTAHQSGEDVLVSDKRIATMLTNELSPAFSEILTTPVDDGVLCLINGDENQFAGIEQALQQVECRVSNYQAQHDLSEDFVIVYSGMLPDISAIHIGIDHVKKAFAQKLLTKDRLIKYSSSYEPSLTVSDFLNPHLCDELRLAVISCDYEKLHSLIDTLCKAMVDNKDICGYNILQVHKELAALFLNITRSNGIDMPEDYLHCAQLDYRGCHTPEELFTRLSNRMSDAVENWKSKKGTQVSYLIHKACQYISEHYTESISLPSVSDYVGLNPSYLSSLFKRETGSTFLDFLTETRIVAARELLVNTNIKIDDLPEKVGYNDYKYFYKCFKKSTGISPKEYRKLYGRY